MSLGRSTLLRPGRLARHLAISLLIAAFGLLLLHAAAGKLLVAAIYDGPLTPLLGHRLEGRSVHDVDHYYSVLTGRVVNLVTMIAAVAFALACLPSSSRRAAAALFSLDFLFIAIDRSFRVVDSQPVRFSISADGGYPELFQYVKEAWIAVALVLLYRRRHCGMYLVWSVLFLYLLVDDSFSIHEQLGLVLSTRFEFPVVMGLRPRDLGELLVTGSVGTLIIVPMVLTYFQAPPAEKRIARSLLALLGVLALSGVGLDMVAEALESTWIALLEDAGEMLAVSAIVWYVDRRLTDTIAPERARATGRSAPSTSRRRRPSRAELPRQ